VRGFTDPPKLRVDPADGTPWIAFVDPDAAGGDRVYLIHRPAGGGWGAPIALTGGGSAEQRQPNLAIDAQGRAHVVYGTLGPRGVRYAVVSREGAVLEDVALSGGLSGTWGQTAIALDEGGNAHAVWAETVFGQPGRLWFTTNRPERSAVARWTLYR
jgi:hypothetical protein